MSKKSRGPRRNKNRCNDVKMIKVTHNLMMSIRHLIHVFEGSIERGNDIPTCIKNCACMNNVVPCVYLACDCVHSKRISLLVYFLFLYLIRIFLYTI